MKHLLLIAMLVLTACGPDSKSPQVESVTCTLHYAHPVQATYPDGQTRKSGVYACSNGCGEYRFVDDESIKFNTCEFQPGLVQP